MKIFVAFTLWVFLSTFLNNIIFSYIPPRLKNSDNHTPVIHLIAYMTISSNDIYISSIVKKYKFIDSGFTNTGGLKIKEIYGNEIIVIGYQDMMGIHSTYSYYDEIKIHENWFIHNELGHRMRNRNYGWYLMNVGNVEFTEYMGNRLVNVVSESKYDGVFGDDVNRNIPTSQYNAEILNEPHVVDGDGITISSIVYDIFTVHPHVWKPVPIVRDLGNNVLDVTSFTANTIVLTNSLPPGTNVVVDYIADINVVLNVAQNVQDEWESNYGVYLSLIREKLDLHDIFIVINCGIECPYSNSVDGYMVERWLGGWGSTAGRIGPDGKYVIDFERWRESVDDLHYAMKENLVYMALSKITDDTIYTNELFQQQLQFCYTSYLLGLGEYSSFFFANYTYSETIYSDLYNISVGNPLDDYYRIYQNYTNLYFNPSNFANDDCYFDKNFTDSPWKKTEFWGGKCNFTMDDEVYYSPPYSFRVSQYKDNQECTGGGYQDFSSKCKPNTWYTVSGWVKVNNITSDSYAGHFYAEIVGDTIHRIGFTQKGDGFSEDWSFFSQTFQTPSSVTICRVGFYVGRSIYGMAWFDNFILEEGKIERQIKELYSRDYENIKVFVNPHPTPTDQITLDDIFINEKTGIKYQVEYFHPFTKQPVKEIQVDRFNGIILSRKSKKINLILSIVLSIVISFLFITILIGFVICIIVISLKKGKKNHYQNPNVTLKSNI